MGWRFRKTIRLGKGININLSRRGVGWSAGIPGSGLRYVSSPGPGRRGAGGSASASAPRRTRRWAWEAFLVFLAAAAVFVLAGPGEVGPDGRPATRAVDVLVGLAVLLWLGSVAFRLVRWLVGGAVSAASGLVGGGGVAAADARLEGDGTFPVEVVGESSYRRNFEAIFGRRTADGVDELVEAVLVPEDDNPHDPDAVQVRIGGRTVGYLGRDDAATFRRLVASGSLPEGNLGCAARVRGGWDRGPDDRGDFGVRLDFALSRRPASRGGPKPSRYR